MRAPLVGGGLDDLCHEHVGMNTNLTLLVRDPTSPRLPMTSPNEKYLEEQQIESKLAVAMATVIREKPKNAAARLAQLLSPAPPPTAEYLSTVGSTPLIELKKLLPAECKAKAVLVKMEMQNPGGSIKDRIAKEIIEAAEADGSLKPGMTVVEATSGNTGIGLAMCCAAKGANAHPPISHLTLPGIAPSRVL